ADDFCRLGCERTVTVDLEDEVVAALRGLLITQCEQRSWRDTGDAEFFREFPRSTLGRCFARRDHAARPTVVQSGEHILVVGAEVDIRLCTVGGSHQYHGGCVPEPRRPYLAAQGSTDHEARRVVPGDELVVGIRWHGVLSAACAERGCRPRLPVDAVIVGSEISGGCSALLASVTRRLLV